MKKKKLVPEVNPQTEKCYFKCQCKVNGTTVWNELLTGITTFLILSFSYYQSSTILVNALNISGEHIPGIITTMLLFSALLSILAGIYIKKPLVYTISTGLTVFLTAETFSHYHMGISSGFALLLLEGIVFLILAFSGIPKWIVEHAPTWIRKGSPAFLGSLLILFALHASGFISVSSDTPFLAQTIRTPAIFLFVFGTILTLVLHFTKTKNAFLLSILITLFFGMILSKNPANPTFPMSWLILIGYIAGWLMLFSIFYDKKVKFALEKSLWILVAFLFGGVLLYTNSYSILLRPDQWIGNQGVFSLPTFSLLPIFGGSSVTTVPLFLNQMGTFWAPFISLLLLHITLFVCMFFTMEVYLPTNQDTNEKSSIFSKMMITEGMSSLFAGNSALAPLQSSSSSPIALLLGAKTGISSIFFGLANILGIFFIPLLSYVFLPIAFCPALLSAGIVLVIRTFELYESYSIEELLPIIATFSLTLITNDLVQSLLIGLLLYAAIGSFRKKQIPFSLWILIIALIIFEFFRIVIPYFSFS
jgi:xanthine/uracil/vitamin C permease (AzgA family)